MNGLLVLGEYIVRVCLCVFLCVYFSSFFLSLLYVCAWARVDVCLCLHKFVWSGSVGILFSGCCWGGCARLYSLNLLLSAIIAVTIIIIKTNITNIKGDNNILTRVDFWRRWTCEKKILNRNRGKVNIEAKLNIRTNVKMSSICHCLDWYLKVSNLAWSKAGVLTVIHIWIRILRRKHY